MRVRLKEDIGSSAIYELSVEGDGLVLTNERETLGLKYRDMERFWFRRFAASMVSFVIEMTGAVYEGRFLDPSDAKAFTEQLNQKAGDSMEVIFNLNQKRDRRYVL